MSDYDKYQPQAAKWLLADGTITDKLPVEGLGGGGDMTKEVYDTDDDGKVDAAATADSVPWSGVTGKPSTFPPATHDHDGVYAPIDHTHSEYASANHNHDGTYAPASHTHSQYLEASPAEAQADSTASDVAGLVDDFNALLAKLRAAGLMSE